MKTLLDEDEDFKIDNKSLVELKEKIKFEKRVNDGVPSLASLVDKFSYLMFHRIGLDEQRIRDWLSLPPQIGVPNQVSSFSKILLKPL